MEVSLSKPCCWMGILKKEEGECAVLLLYRTGHIEIRWCSNWLPQIQYTCQIKCSYQIQSALKEWFAYVNRSFPDLEVVGESSLLSLLRWNFKPNMEKTVCSNDFGHLVLVRLPNILSRRGLLSVKTVTTLNNLWIRLIYETIGCLPILWAWFISCA